VDRRPPDPRKLSTLPVRTAVVLREFVQRLLGWADDRADAVELAVRSITLTAHHRAALVLSGAGDLVPIARALHRRIFGDDRTFAVADPRRNDGPASVRMPASHRTAAQALAAVRGGSLCVRSERLPHDFASVTAQLRHTNDVVLIICAHERNEASPLLVRPAPTHVPPLTGRTSELPRIIDEYALDAITALDAANAGFTKRDHDWVHRHASESLAAIEKATLRLVAIRATGTPSAAAARVGMAPVSLLRWLERRRQHR
jgi:hypothetical protein